jgi:hypothetical protein
MEDVPPVGVGHLATDLATGNLPLGLEAGDVSTEKPDLLTAPDVDEAGLTAIPLAYAVAETATSAVTTTRPMRSSVLLIRPSFRLTAPQRFASANRRGLRGTGENRKISPAASLLQNRECRRGRPSQTSLVSDTRRRTLTARRQGARPPSRSGIGTISRDADRLAPSPQSSL